MKISLIINSAACDPLVNASGNRYRATGYSERYRILKEKVLPAALSQDFDEVFVCGSFEAGKGYEYIPLDPRYRDRRDALWQREMGARYATGDVLVFSHDDHALDSNFNNELYLHWCGVDESKAPLAQPWDLLIPRRTHGITGATLENGKTAGYMGGHALVMKRWLWARVGWLSVDTEWWDVSLSRLWREAGGKLVHCEDLIHVDMEATEAEA